MNKPSQSDIVSKGIGCLFACIFRPLAALAGDPGACPASSTLWLSIRHFLAGTVVAGFVFLFISFTYAFKIGIKTGLGKILGYVIGMPGYLAMTYFYLWSVKLFALAMFGRKGNEDLPMAVNIPVYVVGALIIFGAPFGYLLLSERLDTLYLRPIREREALVKEQKEYLDELEKGSRSWNFYINRNPMHFITFDFADLSGKNLSDYDLHLVKFRHATLKGTNFSRTNLTGANFEHADATDANFREAYIPFGTFTKTNLTRADFNGAYCEPGTIADAILNDTRQSSMSSRWKKSPWRKQ